MSRSPRSDSSPSGGQSSDDWFDAPVSSPRPSSHAANPPAAPTPAPASPFGRLTLKCQGSFARCQTFVSG